MATEANRDEEIGTIVLKAPIAPWFNELDEWRELQIAKPSRPASIRWIVYQFLMAEKEKREKQAKQQAKPRPRKGRRAA